MASAEKRGNGPTPWRARYTKSDGTVGSKPGFRTKTAALKWGRDQEAAIRAGTWIDPDAGGITLDEYFALWLPAQDLSDSTDTQRESLYRNHLSPRWGDTPIAEIDPIEVQGFEKDLRKRRKGSTAGNVMRVFRMMMADAVYARRLGFSPVMPARRRGRKVVDDKRKGIATTVPALEAIRGRLPGPEALLILVIAFTGMRWGEACGMRRSFLMLMPASDDGPASGWYEIDEDEGAVHEDKKAKRYFGPPKNRKGRTIELPPFLVELLLAYLPTVPAGRDLLFVDSDCNAHRRSNFGRYRWRPACDGWPERKASRNHPGRLAAPPIVETLRIHDLRHTHKTWLMEDRIPAVAIDERLGHATPGMDGIYGHATPAMRAEILVALQRRWEAIHIPVKS
jgi:integrase